MDPAEEGWILGDESNGFTHGRKIDFVVGPSIAIEDAGVRPVEPQNQVQDGALAATIGADERYRAPRPNDQVDPVQHSRLAVAEGNILEPDLTLKINLAVP